jgi:drug/metabolite transporter (DMT)-like permease
MQETPLIVRLAMAGTMFLWGISFVASKIVLAEISPLTYMGIRFLIASVLLAGVMAIRGRPRFSAGTHGLIAVTALAEPVAYFLFESYGISLIPATLASLVIATTPIAVMILAALFLGESIRPVGLIAVLVSIGGIALLVFGATDAGNGTGSEDITRGVLLVFGAVFSAACYITLARNLTQRHDPVNLTVVQTWWGAGVFVILWQLQQPAMRSLETLSTTGWIALIFLATGATVAAFLLYNWSLRYASAGEASVYINGIPLVTAITGWFVLGEQLVFRQWIGALLVLLSVWLAGRISRSPAVIPREM